MQGQIKMEDRYQKLGEAAAAEAMNRRQQILAQQQQWGSSFKARAVPA
jgi:hypothetical protein